MNLDCVGQLCPQPVIALARAAKGSPVGQVILITTDDPAALVDIPAWCRMRGHDCRETARHGGTVTHTVTIAR